MIFFGLPSKCYHLNHPSISNFIILFAQLSSDQFQFNHVALPGNHGGRSVLWPRSQPCYITNVFEHFGTISFLNCLHSQISLHLLKLYLNEYDFIQMWLQFVKKKKRNQRGEIGRLYWNGNLPTMRQRSDNGVYEGCVLTPLLLVFRMMFFAMLIDVIRHHDDAIQIKYGTKNTFIQAVFRSPRDTFGLEPSWKIKALRGWLARCSGKTCRLYSPPSQEFTGKPN